MTRRRRSSAVEDLLDLIALAPWWVGLVLAVVTYLVLHCIAGLPQIKVTTAAQVADSITRGLAVRLAQFGQFVIPILCLVGSAMSWRRRQQRQALVENVAMAKSASVLDGMTWQHFEMLVGEAFRLQGYHVNEVGGGGADGGVDLVLHKGGETFLVQCKQWRALKVGVDVVRELYGVMAARGAAGGFVVTSGRYTNEAKAFADGRNLQLIDGVRLQVLIQQAQRTSPLQAVSAVVEPRVNSMFTVDGSARCSTWSKCRQAFLGV